MIDFVGITPFLRIALRFPMATMNFHIAQTGLFLGNIFFSHSGDPREQFSTHEKLSWGARLVKLDADVVESLVGYGWSLTDSGLTPKLMTQSTAPKELTELTICQCKELKLPLSLCMQICETRLIVFSCMWL